MFLGGKNNQGLPRCTKTEMLMFLHQFVRWKLMLPTSALVKKTISQYVKKGNLTFQQRASCSMVRIKLSLCFLGGAALRHCVCRTGEGLRGDIQHLTQTWSGTGQNVNHHAVPGAPRAGLEFVNDLGWDNALYMSQEVSRCLWPLRGHLRQLHDGARKARLVPPGASRSAGAPDFDADHRWKQCHWETPDALDLLPALLPEVSRVKDGKIVGGAEE